jgi:trigger factor
MKTSVKELPDSRVRVEAKVDAAELERHVAGTAGRLGSELKVPGFRKGKVPPEVVLQRVGREAVMEEALREALPEWYERALLDSGVTPVGDPKLDVAGMPGEGEGLSFSIEVAVRPEAALGDYKGLEAGRAEIEVPADAVEGELERLREGLASLRPVERAASEGDYLLVDYRGEIDGEPFEGGEAHDFLLELGAEGLLDGFNESLTGVEAGDEREVEVRFPDEYRPEQLAGKAATFKVEVKEVREKQLPELDDDFATQASEFDSLGELREDVESKIREALESRADDEFRQGAVDAAVAKATVEVPDDVVSARATEMWQRVERSLQARGISPDTYLQMQGRSRDELIAEARPEAEQALKREAVLAAIADEEGIEIGDEELVDSLRHAAEHEDVEPEKLLGQLRSSGRDALLREELRLRKAADIVAESANPIAMERAEAREKLWTPEKQPAGSEPAPERTATTPGKLWTPGDES